MAYEPPKPISSGEGESPLMKPSVGQPTGGPNVPNIEIRSMGADTQSMKESGSVAPRPYTPPPAPRPPEIPKPQIPSEPAFRPPQAPFSAMPESSPAGGFPKPSPVAAVMPVAVKSSSKKGLFAAIITLIVIVGLGAAGYFFIYPTFFKTPAQEPIEQPVIPQQEPISVPEIPQAEPETVPETPAPQAEEPAVIPTHTSFFKTAADSSKNISLAALSLAEFKKAVEFGTAQVVVFTEIVTKDADGNLIQSPDFLKIFLPDFWNSETAGLFELDFTVFTYIDSNGTWPGVVLKLKADSVLADAQAKISPIESQTDVKNFYLTDPGTASAWKTGSIGGKASRYLSYSLNGASLNYVWLDNSLLISASYNGAKEAAKRLGF